MKSKYHAFVLVAVYVCAGLTTPQLLAYSLMVYIPNFSYAPWLKFTLILAYLVLFLLLGSKFVLPILSKLEGRKLSEHNKNMTSIASFKIPGVVDDGFR